MGDVRGGGQLLLAEVHHQRRQGPAQRGRRVLRVRRVHHATLRLHITTTLEDEVRERERKRMDSEGEREMEREMKGRRVCGREKWREKGRKESEGSERWRDKEKKEKGGERWRDKETRSYVYGSIKDRR